MPRTLSALAAVALGFASDPAAAQTSQQQSSALGSEILIHDPSYPATGVSKRPDALKGEEPKDADVRLADSPSTDVERPPEQRR